MDDFIFHHPNTDGREAGAVNTSWWGMAGLMWVGLGDKYGNPLAFLLETGGRRTPFKSC